jgi:hypothetical protein
MWHFHFTFTSTRTGRRCDGRRSARHLGAVDCTHEMIWSVLIIERRSVGYEQVECRRFVRSIMRGTERCCFRYALSTTIIYCFLLCSYSALRCSLTVSNPLCGGAIQAEPENLSDGSTCSSCIKALCLSRVSFSICEKKNPHGLLKRLVKEYGWSTIQPQS